MEYQLILAVGIGVALLLFLILRFRIQAFLALLIVCIVVGVIAGMEPKAILDTVKEGMGGTLGFVATVVGLGALFGAILEHSGGAQRLAASLLRSFGEKNAPWSIMITGFVVAIPVFFDVAFIILVPVIYALQKKTGKSLIIYAIPLLAGLAITHSFIPPTPGPIAVAEILGAKLGWVIVFGFIVGVPSAILAGPLFAKQLAKKMNITAPVDFIKENAPNDEAPSPFLVIGIIALPILLIVMNTVLNSPLLEGYEISTNLLYVANLLGHPFTALIIANLIAWWLLGIRRGVSKETLLNISTKSLAPAGVIILLTGAGGAFKQILINTGAGKMIAESLSSDYFPPVVFGFVIAAIVRIMQGSATVAMITAAGITAPLLVTEGISEMHKAILVIAIASGATIFSHVNDSGFWLVKEYLGITERQTFRSWSVMTTLIAGVGLLMSVLLWYIV